MNKDKVLKISKKIIQLLMLFQIVLGIIFIIKNINYMPEYGDTKDFLELAKTLKLPSYRPFVYPYTLNIASKIANILSVNLTYIIYFIQSIINLFACMVLVGTLKDTFKISLKKKEFILYALFIFTIPFNLHFNLSVKCDSLSTSFTILFLCYLIKYMKTEKNKFAIYTLITMFIASNIRSEKLYFLAFVLVGMIAIEIFLYLYHKRKAKLNVRKIITIFLILVLGITTTNIAKGIFQKEEESTDTSESTILLYAYERIVHDSLPDIYDYLPDDVKQSISYDDAVASTVDGNTYKLPYLKLLEEDGNLNRVNKIIKVAIRRNFPQIAMNISGDFLKNMIPPYYIIFDTSDAMYVYTLTRMEGEHSLFADGYVLYFNIVFILMNAYIIFNKVEEKLKNVKDIIVMLLYGLASAGFFSLLTGFNFHIRYAMPVYVLEIAIITMLFNRNSKKQEMKIHERKTNH